MPAARVQIERTDRADPRRESRDAPPVVTERDDLGLEPVIGQMAVQGRADPVKQDAAGRDFARLHVDGRLAGVA